VLPDRSRIALTDLAVTDLSGDAPPIVGDAASMQV
jgi:hypothetical protein